MLWRRDNLIKLCLKIVMLQLLHVDLGLRCLSVNLLCLLIFSKQLLSIYLLCELILSCYLLSVKDVST